VKTVCLALGLARSNVYEKAQRPDDWVDGRTAAWADPDSDALLLDAVRAEITALPTYGYRRAGALANRTRSHIGLPTVNHKQYYRVMTQYGLLLPKAPKRRVSSRPHEAKVAGGSRIQPALVFQWL
jgi:putative transposase